MRKERTSGAAGAAGYGVSKAPEREDSPVSVERYRRMLEDIPALVCSFTPDYTLTYVNAMYARSLGRRPEALVGTCLLDLLPEEERTSLLESFRAMTPENPVVEVEHPVIAARGEIRWHRWKNRAIFRDGRIVEYQSVGEDITDRKLAEERLRLIVEHSQDTIFFQDADLRYAWIVRPAVPDSEGEVIGRTDREIPGIMDPDRLMEIKREVLETGEVRKNETHVLLPGVERWMSAVYVPRRDAGGKVVGLFGYAHDVTAMKRAGEDLRRHERQFRSLVENSPDIIARFDRDLRYVYVNPVIEQVAGIPHKQCIGRTNGELNMPPALTALWDDVVARTFSTGDRQAMEFALPCPDRLRYFHARLVPEPGPGGAVETVLVIARDVTPLRRAEEDLLKREQAFRTLSEISPDAISRFDRELRHMYVNSSHARLTGLPMEKVIGKTVRETDSFNVTAKAWESTLLRAFQTGRGAELQFEYAGPEGRGFHHSRFVPEFDDDGEVRTVMAVTRDVTGQAFAGEDPLQSPARRETGEEERTAGPRALTGELSREREVFQAILDHIPVMISFYDAAGNVPFLNTAFERITGWTVEEWQTRNVTELVYPDPEYRREVQEYMRNPRPGWKDLTMRARDGRTIETSWSNILLSDGSRIGIGIDITERKQVEAELAVHRERLEETVRERTTELAEANCHLEQEIRAHAEAVDALRESEELLSAFFTQSPVGMSLFDEELRYVRVNETTALYAGRPVHDMLGKTLAETIPAKEAAYGPYLRGVIENGTAFPNVEFEVVLPGRPKERTEFMASIFPVRLPGGRRGAGVISRDITGIRKAHRELRRSERRFLELVESASSVIMRFSPDGTILSMNNYGLRLFGYSREEIVGRNAVILISERDSAGNDLVAMVQAILNDPEPFRVNENENVKKNGKIVTMAWTNTALRDEQGNIIEFLSIGNDITHLKRAEEALRLSEERYRAVSRLVSDLAYSFRMEPGREPELEWVSGPFERLTGYNEREMATLSKWRVMIHPDDREMVEQNIARQVESLVDSVCEYRIVSRGGETVWLRVYSHSEPDAGGKVVRIYGAAQDITERRRLAENVERLRREQEAFMAHEVKNLLIPLHIYVETLRVTAGELDEESRELLQKIKTSTDRAFDVANAFTRLYDLESGTCTLRLTRQSLSEVVCQTVEELSLTAGQHGVTLLLSGDERRAVMEMDAHLMPGVFFNLILNAIEHVAPLDDPGEKTIRVEMSRAGRRTVVCINNRGVPIPPDRLATFFDKFNVGEGKKQGIGLGTTYAALVTRAHQGEIRVESNEREGTTVTLSFPTR